MSNIQGGAVEVIFIVRYSDAWSYCPKCGQYCRRGHKVVDQLPAPTFFVAPPLVAGDFGLSGWRFDSPPLTSGWGSNVNRSRAAGARRGSGNVASHSSGPRLDV